MTLQHFDVCERDAADTEGKERPFLAALCVLQRSFHRRCVKTYTVPHRAPKKRRETPRASGIRVAVIAPVRKARQQLF